jgi:hypothetical protein
VTAVGTPTAVAGAPASTDRNPHRVHATRGRRRQHRTKTCRYQRQAAQDHERHDLRLEY